MGQYDSPPKIDLFTRCRHPHYRYPCVVLHCTLHSSLVIPNSIRNYRRYYYTESTSSHIQKSSCFTKPFQEEKQLFRPCSG